MIIVKKVKNHYLKLFDTEANEYVSNDFVDYEILSMNLIKIEFEDGTTEEVNLNDLMAQFGVMDK